MEMRDSQYIVSGKYLEDLNRFFSRCFDECSTFDIHTLKEMATSFIAGDFRLWQFKQFLSKDAVTLLDKAKRLQMLETDKEHQERIKKLSAHVAGLCRDAVKANWCIIDSITGSKDRVKKLIQFLKARNDFKASRFPSWAAPPDKVVVADFKNTSSIDDQLRQICLRITTLQLVQLEKYEPYFSALFCDNDFVRFVEYRVQQKDETYCVPTKRLRCVHDSLSCLDHFRIDSEDLAQQSLQESRARYEAAIAGYNKYLKKLGTLQKKLAGIHTPKQAKLKEFITHEGFKISEKIGEDILLSDKGQAVEKEIQRLIKTAGKQKFRSKDKQQEKNFPVYNFLNSKLNPCDFIEHKTETINRLVNDFLSSATALASISSTKDLNYVKGGRQMTVRMPKPTVAKIQRLAKKHNISQQLLLNIIIQHSAKAIQSSGEGYYKVEQEKKAEKAKRAAGIAHLKAAVGL